ncbi:hypothetical protein HG531_009168 [Fusarium graminearum]|nr:hypothetical protein HG531_009168 [Fusarium graminearum]
MPTKPRLYPAQPIEIPVAPMVMNPHLSRPVASTTFEKSMAEDYIRQAQRSVYRGSKRDDNTVPGEKFLCHDTATIKILSSADDENIDGCLNIIKHVVQEMELLCTKLTCLRLLTGARASADSQDTYPFLRGDGSLESSINSRTGTLKRRGMLAGEALGDLVQVCLLSDIILAKSPVIEVAFTEDDTIVAVYVFSGKTILAVAARVSMETTTSAISDVELCHERSHGFDDADTLVPKSYGSTHLTKRDVCMAYTAMCDAHKNVMGTEGRHLDGGWGEASITVTGTIDDFAVVEGPFYTGKWSVLVWSSHGANTNHPVFDVQ